MNKKRKKNAMSNDLMPIRIRDVLSYGFLQYTEIAPVWLTDFHPFESSQNKRGFLA